MTQVGEIDMIISNRKELVHMSGINWKSMHRSQAGSILIILCGAVLVMNPDSASALVSAILGWGLILVGVVLIVGGFLGGGEWGSIVQGALFLIVGSWLHRNPLMIASVLGLLLGLAAVRHGWRAAKNAQLSKRLGGFWVPGMVLAAVELLVGVRLILSPLSVSRLVLTLAGIAMVACGVWELVVQFRGQRYIPGNPNIIDAEK